MTTSFSLLSPGFLLLSLVAVVALTSLRALPRQLAFLTINLYFLVVLLLEPAGAVALLAFCLLGYLLCRGLSNRRIQGLTLPIFALTALFIYMQQYAFLRLVLPDFLLTRMFAVAGLSFLFFKIVHVMIEAQSATLGRLDLLTYLNYCFNFTTFLMGPIQRFPDYREQWSGEKPAIPLAFEPHLDAVLRILKGLVKAYAIAPWILTHTMAVRADAANLHWLEMMLAVYLFYPYLYLNFSGYCDVAIGVGSLFGVRPPENFDRPFAARNISDFWLRMHRSLTLWLTDYVFNPVYKWSLQSQWGRGRSLTCLNVSLMITMLISGLWHGTTFAFLLFGILHGLYQIIFRTWDTLLLRALGRKRLRELREQTWAHALGVFLTCNAAAIAYIFFCLDARQGLRVFARIFGF